MTGERDKGSRPSTRLVSVEVFREVYDSPRSLPGEERWLTVDEDVRAIAGLVCYECKEPIRDLRNFKCHNWAYAYGDLAKVLERVSERPSE